MSIEGETLYKAFIEQTAKDYDLTIEEVERAYQIYYPDLFYKELESLIDNRNETQNLK